jgi:uncharacterized protein YwqG
MKMLIITTLIITFIVVIAISKIRQRASSPHKSHFQGGTLVTSDEILDRYRAVGYAKVADKLTAQAIPCFLMDHLPPGSTSVDGKPLRTKLGGRPDLPEGTPWPKRNGKSLAFIGQLDLSDLLRTDTRSILPDKGILYFFYDTARQPWGFDPKDKGGWQVVYLQSVPPTQSAADFPKDLPREGRYTEIFLKPRAGRSIPNPAEIFPLLSMSDSEEDDALDIYGQAVERPPRHQVLGYPAAIQDGNMQLECQLASHGLFCGNRTGYNDPQAKTLASGASEWVLLAQIDSDKDAGMMWGDMGRLYFWIIRNDLKARRFENIWLVQQCY